jgi:hypothetical protein
VVLLELTIWRKMRWRRRWIVRWIVGCDVEAEEEVGGMRYDWPVEPDTGTKSLVGESGHPYQIFRLNKLRAGS